MPSYEVRVWVIEDGRLIEKNGLLTHHLSRATEFAAKVLSEITDQISHVTISNLSNGRELQRKDFEKAIGAAASYSQGGLNQ